MTATRLERIHHRGELKEHRAGNANDTRQDNHLAHRQVGNGQQLREPDNTRQNAGDDKHEEHHTQGRERLRDAPNEADARRARREQAHGGKRELAKAKHARHKDIERRGQNDRQRGWQCTLEHVGQERPLHAGVVGLQAQHKARRTDAEEVDERHLYGLKGIWRQRDTKRCKAHREQRLGEEQRRGALQVIDGTTALGHHGGHRGKVVVDEHDLGHVARGVGAGGHGHGAVGFLERQHVVDAVARHGHGVLATLERLHKLALLLRRHTTKNVIAVHRRVELGRRIERRGVHIGIGPRHAHHARDRRHRAGVVAADHVEGNALLVKVPDGLGGRGANLVADGHKAHGLGLAHHITIGRKAFHAGHHEHATGVGKLCHTVLDLCKGALRKHKLCRAHHIGALHKRGAAPLFGR